MGNGDTKIRVSASSRVSSLAVYGASELALPLEKRPALDTYTLEQLLLVIVGAGIDTTFVFGGNLNLWL